MGLPVVTVASGGLPVGWVSASPYALAVTEAASGFGISVTKVASGGMPVTYITTAGAPVPPVTTLDGVATNVTLSNGNLTATHNLAASNSGARSTALKSAGKYYFEATFTATHGTSDCVGILLSAGTYANLLAGTSCSAVFATAGAIIWSNNASTTHTLGGDLVAGDVVCVAVDLDARRIWFRKGAGGAWNGVLMNGNPAAGTGGEVVAAGSFAPVIGFGGATPGNVGDNITANFGASSFVGAVPSGFTAGWPA